MHRRRIFCETIPPSEAAAPAPLALLRQFGVSPILAVWPDTIAAVRAAAARFTGEGLPVAVWPMLADVEGRWGNAANQEPFRGFLQRVADELAPSEIVIDLEPSIEVARGSLLSRTLNVHALPMAVAPAAFRAVEAKLRTLSAALRGRGIVVSAAVAPPIVFDSKWEAFLGTPVSGVTWDHVSPMLYSSIFEGWSRRLLGRADARALLGAACCATAARFGARAGASLGAVGAGAFGDEPIYRTPSELADDVAIACAAGLEDLTLFELGGVLRRRPPEAWLEALTGTPKAMGVPPATLRSRAAVAGVRAAGGAFAAIAGVRSMGERAKLDLKRRG